MHCDRRETRPKYVGTWYTVTHTHTRARARAFIYNIRVQSVYIRFPALLYSHLAGGRNHSIIARTLLSVGGGGDGDNI